MKFRDYERHGVKEYWLVDPRDKHIRVYVLEGERYELLGVFAGPERVASRVLAGVPLVAKAAFQQ